MITELKKLQPIDCNAIDYCNGIDILTLFNENNIAKTVHNLFVHIINKQIDIDKEIEDIPLFVAHKNNLEVRTINLEYNAFIYGLGQLFSEKTRDRFIDEHKLSGFNLRDKKKVRVNFSVLNLIEEITDIFYLYNYNKYTVSVKFYNPIVYKFGENPPVQMSCIFFNYERIFDLISRIDSSDSLVENINYIYAATCDNLEQKAFGNKPCNEYWEREKSPKKVLFSL